MARRNSIIIAHWLVGKTVSQDRKGSQWLLQIWNRQLFLLLGIKNKKAVFFGLTRVNPSDPWPDHLTGSMTGSGFKTMSMLIDALITCHIEHLLVYHWDSRAVFGWLSFKSFRSIFIFSELFQFIWSRKIHNQWLDCGRGSCFGTIWESPARVNSPWLFLMMGYNTAGMKE